MDGSADGFRSRTFRRLGSARRNAQGNGDPCNYHLRSSPFSRRIRDRPRAGYKPVTTGRVEGRRQVDGAR